MSAHWYDKDIQHHIGLQRYSNSLVRKILTLLAKVEKDLLAQVQKMSLGEARKVRDKQVVRRLAAVREVMKEGYDKINGTLGAELVDLAGYEVAFQNKNLQYMVGEGIMLKPTKEMLKAAVDSRPFQGRILKEWGAELSVNAYKRVQDQVRIGYLEGESIDQIVRRLRGTRSAKFKDGVLAISRRGAEGLVRTAVNHTENAAKSEFIKKNKSVFSGVRWNSVLDNRTTPQCRALDGEVFPLDSGPRPPAHWNCRSMITPVIKGENSQPPETYQQWLMRQSTEVQDDILGPTRAKLFRSGEITLDRFVDPTGRQYTLKELAQREGL